MDNLNYTYATCTNKHTQVNDGVSSTAYASYGFAPGQATGNYVYNVLGELEADAVNGKKYEYNSTGQISRILNSTNQPVAEYVYDESGQRMLKISYNGSTVVKTFYVRDGDGSVIAIHEQNGSANPYVLKELALSGDGREGTVYKQAGGDVYSYELTDHLGSTRAVIKEGALQTLAFSMDVVPATGNNLTYFTDNYTTIVNAGGNKVSRVLAPAKPEGVSTVLIPVKAGDVVQSRVYAAFTTVVSGSSINAWLVGDVLDENGNVLSTQGVQVSSSSYQTNVQYILNQSIVQNGYLRVYVKSNELFAVDFDDLQVQFSVGGVRIPEVMEAVAYYPHGSELPGLSYHSSLGGRYGYQGQYAERDKEVNEDFFELRNYNSLLGRFNTIDPYEQYWSPYLAMGNNHPNMVDPDGGFSVTGAVIGLGAGFLMAIADDVIYKQRTGERTSFARFGGIMASGALIGGFGIRVTHISNAGFFSRKDWEKAAYRVGFDPINKVLNGKASRSFYFKVTFGKEKNFYRWETIESDKIEPGSDILLPDETYRYRSIGIASGNDRGKSKFKIRLNSIFGWRYGKGYIHNSEGTEAGRYQLQRRRITKTIWKKFGLKVERFKGWKK